MQGDCVAGPVGGYRPVTCAGSFSDGGCSGPWLAQPESATAMQMDITTAAKCAGWRKTAGLGCRLAVAAALLFIHTTKA